MSRVYKCDKCKTIYEKNNKFPIKTESLGDSYIGGVAFENVSGITIPNLRFNLCDECLSEWLRELGKEDLKED